MIQTMAEAEKHLKEIAIIYGWESWDIKRKDENVTLEIDSVKTIDRVTFQNSTEFYNHVSAMLPRP